MEFTSTFNLTSRNGYTYKPECFRVGDKAPVTFGVNKSRDENYPHIGEAEIVSVGDMITIHGMLNENAESMYKDIINNSSSEFSSEFVVVPAGMGNIKAPTD